MSTNGSGDVPAPQDDVAVVGERRRVGPAVAGVVLALLALLVLVLATRSPSSERGVDSPLLGKQAPLTQAVDFRGEPFDLDDLRGQWVVVNFFATWCGPCIREHPELVSFADRHAAARDATVVSIAFDDEGSDVEAFFRQAGGDWPVLVKDTGAMALDWSVAQVPETYLVAPNGLVVAKLIGGVEADELDRFIAQFSEGSS